VKKEMSGVLAYLVLVDNPPQHPQGDFAYDGKNLLEQGSHMLTFSGIGVYRPELFSDVARGSKAKLAPLLRTAIAQGRAGAEHFRGRWMDVGTPQRLSELDTLLKPEVKEV
jgi:MurNAc alpha-1-phosphate uridylyltransferase